MVQIIIEYKRAEDLKRLDFIASNLSRHLPHGGKVLDVGCGNGIISRYLGRLGYEVLGIDISEKAIARAVSLNYLPNVSFEVRAAEELQADGRRYDAIVCSEILEHLSHPEKLLNTLRDLLNPAGILIVTVPNGYGPRELLVTRPVQGIQQLPLISGGLNVLKRMLGYRGVTDQSAADDLRHVQFFTIQQLRKLANQTGFRIKALSNANFIEGVFPFSLVTRRISTLQWLDCFIADMLPPQLSSGFYMVWSLDTEKSHSTGKIAA